MVSLVPSLRLFTPVYGSPYGFRFKIPRFHRGAYGFTGFFPWFVPVCQLPVLVQFSALVFALFAFSGGKKNSNSYYNCDSSRIHSKDPCALAQLPSSFNLFNPFNSFNFGCGSAALGVFVCIRGLTAPLRAFLWPGPFRLFRIFRSFTSVASIFSLFKFV